MEKIFILCEKPDAAAKIASALGKARREERRGVPYYELELDGKKAVVVPSLGHLFTLKNTKPLKDYPVFEVEWVPSYQVDRKASRTKVFLETIRELAQGSSEYVVATDFDVEGSVIGWTVLKFLCGEEAVRKAKRMKFSTLTAQELREAYRNLLPRLDFEQVNAGIARHVLDWYWGMNVSRALSSSVERVMGSFAKLSAGRVQTPTLKILAEREEEIRKFVPRPFWTLKLVVEVDGKELVAEHEVERFWEENEAKKAVGKCGGEAVVKRVEIRLYHRHPPTPFDLGTLQMEAYRCFGYTPLRTQQLAQDLYLAGAISYPRTSSQKLPPAIGYRRILEGLGEMEEYRKSVEILLSKEKLKPREGEKTDPAHPSIYPTGEKAGGLTGGHRNLFDLIVRRFLAVFGDPAVVEGKRIELVCGDQTFHLSGRRVVEKGWLELYGKYAEVEEVYLPLLEEGQKLKVKEVRMEKGETQPPPRYNPASILKEMAERGLGTKATRGPILQNLYDRGYIHGERITVTELGMGVVSALKEWCPEIVSEELTASFEREMEAIQEGKIKKEEVVEKARIKLEEILRKFRERELEIGKKLAEMYRRTRLAQRTLGRCKCGGELRIIPTKNGKRFVGCSNFEKGCRITYPLPSSGTIVTLGKNCPCCGTPLILVGRTGRRPYKMCLEPSCPSKKRWEKNRMGKS
ncbi:MAG: DNA topoisomerase I, partial [Candidatus Hadarchaeales archaeon]